MPAFSVAILLRPSDAPDRAAELAGALVDRLPGTDVSAISVALTQGAANLELRIELDHYPRAALTALARDVEEAGGAFVELWRLPPAERQAFRASHLGWKRAWRYKSGAAISEAVRAHLIAEAGRQRAKANRQHEASAPDLAAPRAPAPEPSRPAPPVRRPVTVPVAPRIHEEPEGGSRFARRFEVSLQVEFRSELEFVREHATNISRGGLFVRTAQRPALDDVVELKVSLPSGQQIVGEAVVVHVSDQPAPGGVGLSFLSDDRSFSDALDGYLLNLSHAAHTYTAPAPQPPRESTPRGHEVPPGLSAAPSALASVAAVAPVSRDEGRTPRASPAPATRDDLPIVMGAPLGVAEPGARCGPFELLECIGQGAVSEVFRARSSHGAWEGRNVAVKWLRRERMRDAAAVELLPREAQLATSLRHPNIVEIFDGGEAEGRPWIAMELIDGGDVAGLLSFCRVRSLELPVDVALHVASGVLRGLDRAHNAVDRDGRAQRIVHCDVSPGNVLVSRLGEVKLGDFGVAQTRNGLALASSRLGKQHYRSPELERGEITADADLWAVGVLLYELLTLQPPPPGADVATSLREWAPHVPDEVERVVARALTPSRAQRFRSAAELERTVSAAMRDAGSAPLILATIIRAAEVERRRGRS